VNDVTVKTEPTRSMNLKNRVDTLVISRRSSMFGLAEVAALACSCFVLLLVLLSYLYFYLPARSRHNAALADRVQLKTNLEKLRAIVSKGQSSTITVNNIAASLQDFESKGLTRQDQGRLALYDELNQIIIKNGVRNTSGPTYTAVDPKGTKVTPGKSVNTKWQSYYPGLAVTVTVEGPYQKVRHFISDIERSKQFLIINEVELQRATDNNAPVNESGAKASLVSLQLSMATYFQRGSEGSIADQE
jgi:Tfp pilus assembly protein PilO